MKVRIKGKLVEVKDKLCAKRSCFWLGEDKGSFVPGRGYTSYHEKPIWCCMRRHLHGCPTTTVCVPCQSGHVEGETACRNCGGPLTPKTT